MRVFDTSHLGQQNVLGSALQQGMQTQGLLAQYDDIKRRKVLQKQQDEDRVRALADADVQRERNTTLFNQQQETYELGKEDRLRNIEYQEANHQRLNEQHLSTLANQELNRKNAISQEERAVNREQREADTHAWQNDPKYLEKVREIELAHAQLGVDAAETEKETAKLRNNEIKRQNNIAKSEEMLFKVGTMIDRGEKPAAINKALAEFEKTSGFSVEKMDEQYPIVAEFAEKIGAEWKLDSPEAKEAMKIIMQPQFTVSGRSMDWSYDNAILTGDMKYSIQMRNKDGGNGYMTHAQGTDKNEVVQTYTPTKVLGAAQQWMKTRQDILQLQQAYNPQAPKETPKPKWKVHPETGEYYDENSQTPPEGVVPGQAESAERLGNNPDSKVLDEHFENSPEVDDRLMYEVLKPLGFGTIDDVAGAREFAKKNKIRIQDAGPMYAQQQYNKVQVPSMTKDLSAMEEYSMIKPGTLKQIIKTEMGKDDGNIETVLAALDKEREDAIRRAENRKKTLKEGKEKRDAQINARVSANKEWRSRLANYFGNK